MIHVLFYYTIHNCPPWWCTPSLPVLHGQRGTGCDSEILPPYINNKVDRIQLFIAHCYSFGSPYTCDFPLVFHCWELGVSYYTWLFQSTSNTVFLASTFLQRDFFLLFIPYLNFLVFWVGDRAFAWHVKSLGPDPQKHTHFKIIS